MANLVAESASESVCLILLRKNIASEKIHLEQKSCE